MSIWAWALSAYGRPGVPEACLALQDRHGQNTSFLLWAVYAQVSDASLLREGAEVARTWDKLALSPLRDVRRALKASQPPVPDPAREALREDVKAAELRAERILMETLERLSVGKADASPGDALAMACGAWGEPAPPKALAALAAALS